MYTKRKCMKIAFTFFLFLAMSVGLSAQFSNENFENAYSEISKERLWFSFGLGPRIHQTNPGLINTNLESTTNLLTYNSLFKGVKRINNLFVLIAYQAKINYTQPVGLNHGLLLDIAFGDNRAYFGGYTIGWEIPLIRKKTNLHIQPGMAFLMGYTQHFIGELNPVDFTYFANNIIQIGNTQYFNTKLKMHLTQDKVAYIYGPELTINLIPTQSNAGFQLSAGYYFADTQSDAVVLFDPVNRRDNNRKVSSLSVNSSQLNIFNNENILIQKNPFNYSGLRCTASITFDF